MLEMRLCKEDEDVIRDALKEFLEIMQGSGVSGTTNVTVDPEGKICLKAFVDENNVINMEIRCNGDYFARWYEHGENKR